MVDSAIPLGSSLMCFRFIQVAWGFWKKGELPRHDPTHIEGVDAESPLAGEALAEGEALEPGQMGRSDEKGKRAHPPGGRPPRDDKDGGP
jgi:C4-dicarboxylate transporter DctQ subunit